jgi:autotransporter-associated beta strand protein
LEALEDRLVPTTTPFIWTGASPFSSSWSDPRNWQGNVAPGANADLIFPAVAARKTGETVGTLTSAHSITYQGSGYSVLDSTQIGNTIIIGVAFDVGSISATSATGTNTVGFEPVLSATGLAVNVASAGATLRINGKLTGSGGLVKSGSGELQLGGTNTNSGLISVQAGTLTAENSAALGSTTGTIDVDAGATLFLNGSQLGVTIGAKPFSLAGTLRASGFASYAGNVTLANTGASLQTAGPVIEVDNGPGAELGILTLSGTVSSLHSSFPEGLTKEGNGTLVLAHANTYGGGTVVDGGELRITDPAGLGVSTFIPFASQTGTVVKAGAVLAVDTNAAINQPLTLEGNSGPGATPATLAVGAGFNVTWAGGGVSDDIFLQGNGELDAFAFLGGLGGGFGGGFGSAGRLTVTASIVGTGDLSIGGGGTVVLAGSGANTYTGTTFVQGGGLELGKSSTFLAGPAAIAIPGNLVIQNTTVALLDQTVLGVPLPGSGSGQIASTAAVTITDGTLDLNGNSNTLASLTLVGGSVKTGGGTLTLNGDVSASADAHGVISTISGNLSLGRASRTFHVLGSSGTTGLAISAVISGDSLFGFTKDGPATLDLSGANTYSGLTEVKAGALRIENGSALGAGFIAGSQQHPPPPTNAFRATQVDVGARLELAGTTAFNVNEQLTLEPGATLANVGDFSRSWLAPVGLVGVATISNTGTGTFEIDGPISGPGGLNKVGAGDLLLTNNNSFTGPTTIDGGRLIVNGDDASSSVTVQAGATLAGQGTVGAVTVNAHGTIAPGIALGTQVGTLSVSGNVSLDAASVYAVQLETVKGGTVQSQMNATGTVSLGNAALTLSETSAFEGPANFPFTIVHSARGIIGVFATTTISTPALGTGGADTFVVATTTNDVTLTFKGRSQGVVAKLENLNVTSPVREGRVAKLTGTIVDPDRNGTFVLQVNWGDDTPTQIFTYPPCAPRQLLLRHHYRDAGHYTIGLLWKDQNGPPNGTALSVVVIPREP